MLVREKELTAPLYYSDVRLDCRVRVLDAESQADVLHSGCELIATDREIYPLR